MLFLLILIAALICQFLLPWWIIAPIAFMLAFWKATSSGNAFSSGFYAILSLWIIKGLLLTLPNDNILANRVGQLLMLPDIRFNWIILLLISGLIGGLVAGLAAMSGYYTRMSYKQKKAVSKS